MFQANWDGDGALTNIDPSWNLLGQTPKVGVATTADTCPRPNPISLLHHQPIPPAGFEASHTTSTTQSLQSQTNPSITDSPYLSDAAGSNPAFHSCNSGSLLSRDDTQTSAQPTEEELRRLRLALQRSSSQMTSSLAC
eukprot:scpid107713/ scgid28662/ 